MNKKFTAAEFLSLSAAAEDWGFKQTAAALKQAARQAEELEACRKDAERLNKFDRFRQGYGIEDIHEGNRWVVDGPFSNIREAIDAAIERSKA